MFLEPRRALSRLDQRYWMIAEILKKRTGKVEEKSAEATKTRIDSKNCDFVVSDFEGQPGYQSGPLDGKKKKGGSSWCTPRVIDRAGAHIGFGDSSWLPWSLRSLVLSSRRRRCPVARVDSPNTLPIYCSRRPWTQFSLLICQFCLFKLETMIHWFLIISFLFNYSGFINLGSYANY